MNWYKLICELYEAYYRQVNKHFSYRYKPTSNDNKMIAKFVHNMWNEYGKSSVGVNLLIQYFEFQFSYYYRLDTRFGRGVIMSSWVLGDKARKRWLERDKDWDFAHKYILNREIQIEFQKQELSAVNREYVMKRRKYLLELNYEESIKQRYYNNLKGFGICLTSTTLFKPNSIFCQGCKFAEDCKSILSTNYPKIFKLRNLS